VLQVDRRALRQILINLSNNAIKFTEHGAVRLALSRLGEQALVQVCDTGVGIGEVDQKTLFGPFTQVGDPRRRPEGTGMGLHLSARLAQLLDARIKGRAAPARPAASRCVSGTESGDTRRCGTCPKDLP
jgi:signal transduction histidine kinase